MIKKLITSIKNIFSKKRKGSDYFNLYHPDFVENIEPAFKVGNKQYYRFIKETNIPWGRYMFLQTFLHEQALRIDTELLKGYVLLMKKAINGNLKTGIDLVLIVKILTQIESRLELAFEADTTYRLASVIYFDDQEDLYSYDKKINDLKIATWKEARTVDFFYMRPMDELLGLNASSPEDLQTFIANQKELLQELTIEMPAP